MKRALSALAIVFTVAGAGLVLPGFALADLSESCVEIGPGAFQTVENPGAFQDVVTCELPRINRAGVTLLFGRPGRHSTSPGFP